MHTLLFNLFATLTLISGIGVIIVNNAIHSVIFLIIVFINSTCLLLLFKIELLAMMFIIIYVGAIAVLFLFVVMMLNIKIINNKFNFLERYRLKNLNNIIIKLINTPIIKNIIILIITYFIINLITNSLTNYNQNNIINQIYILWNNQITPNKSWILLTISTTNIQNLGYLIYTYYFYYFIMASLILFIAMIGSIILTMYKRKNTYKKQLIYKQVSQSFENSVLYTN